MSRPRYKFLGRVVGSDGREWLEWAMEDPPDDFEPIGLLAAMFWSGRTWDEYRQVGHAEAVHDGR